MIKHFIAPCATKLRSQKEVLRFLEPSLKPGRYTKARKLPLDQIPHRDELHPEDWKATRNIDASIFAKFTQMGNRNDIKDTNLEEAVQEKPELEKYRARNTSTIFCKDDPHPPQRNFEAKRVLMLSQPDFERSPMESWTYCPREPESNTDHDDTLQSEENNTSNGSLESGFWGHDADGQDDDTPCVNQELLGSKTGARFWEHGSLSNDTIEDVNREMMQRRQLNDLGRGLREVESEEEDFERIEVVGQYSLAREKYRDRLSSLLFSKEDGQTRLLEAAGRRLRFTNLLTESATSIKSSINGLGSSGGNNNESLSSKVKHCFTSLSISGGEEENKTRKTVKLKFVNDDQLLERRIEDAHQVKVPFLKNFLNIYMCR